MNKGLFMSTFLFSSCLYGDRKIILRTEEDLNQTFDKTTQNFFSVKEVNIPFESRQQPFFKLVQIIQANPDKIPLALEGFLNKFFGLNKGDINKIKKISTHRFPSLADFFDKFYTRSVEEFLTILGYNSQAVRVKKTQIQQVSIEELLVQIVCELTKYEHIELKEFKFENFQLMEIDLSNRKLTNFQGAHGNLKWAKFNLSNLNGAVFSQAILCFANFTGAILTNALLTSANLSSATLTNANLEGATLTNAKIEHADLNGANLTDAELDEADLTNAKLNNSNLTKAVLNNAKMAGVQLMNSHLSEAKLNNAHMPGIQLTNSNLSEAELNNTEMTGVQLTNSNLSGAKLNNTKISNANLSEARLNGCSSENADFSNSNLTKADLSGATLNGVVMQHVLLCGALLIKADLNNTNMSEAKLTNAIVEGSKLANSNLTNADLSSAKLGGVQITTNSNFNGANLTNANLANAHIQESTFLNADFSKADLTGANITNCNLTNAIFNGAKVSKLNLSGSTVSLHSLIGLNLGSVCLEGVRVDEIFFPDKFEINFIHQCFSPDDFNLLQTIQSIDSSYSQIKLQMMEILIKRINNCTEQEKEVILKFKKSFLRVFFVDALYSDSDVIVEFIKANLLPPKVVPKNSLAESLKQFIKINSEETFTSLRQFLKTSSEENAKLVSTLGLSPGQIDQNPTERQIQLFLSLYSPFILEEELNIIDKNIEEKYPNIAKIISERLFQEGIKESNSKNLFAEMEAKLREKVIGQQEAIKMVTRLLVKQLKSDENSNYFFVGPSGVGKTELAKAIASTTKDNRFVSFSLAQFPDEISVAKLFGPGSSFVGSTDLPLFAKTIDALKPKKVPKGGRGVFTVEVENAVLLFDEFEKAHGNVQKSLLNLFDEYSCKLEYIQGGGGNGININLEYKFKKCIFICTSNLFQKQILAWHQQKMPFDKIAEQFKNLSHYTEGMPIELLNRMTVVPFGPISEGKESYQKLISLKLNQFFKSQQVAFKHVFSDISVSEEYKPKILEILEDKLYGDGTDIRKVNHFLNNELWSPLDKSEVFSLENANNKLLLSFDPEKQQLIWRIFYFFELTNTHKEIQPLPIIYQS